MFKKLAMFVMLIPLAMLGGCSNLTPNQNYALDYGIFTGADVALSVGISTGKIPQADVPQITTDMATAATDVAAGHAWIVANPNLANTVGVYPPQFTLEHSAITVLVGYVTQYGLIVPLPAPPLPIPNPTSLPAKK